MRRFVALCAGLLATFAKASACTGVGLFFAVAVLSVGEILVRWILRVSFIGLSDVAAIGTVIGVAACFPQCAVARGHLSLQILNGVRLPPAARQALDLLGIALTALAFFLIARQLWIYGADLARAGNVSLMLKLPMGPVWQAAEVLLMIAACVEALALVQRLLPSTLEAAETAGGNP